MIDFRKLAREIGTGHKKLVDDSNVIGNPEIMNKFDSLMSNLHQKDFASQVKSFVADKTENVMQNEGNFLPDAYLYRIQLSDLKKTLSETFTNLQVINQDNAYRQYNEQIKKLCKEMGCDTVADLINKFGDRKPIASALSTLQKTFDSNPGLKSAYAKVLTGYQRLSLQLSDLKVQVRRGESNDLSQQAVIGNIAIKEFDNDKQKALESYRKELNDLKEVQEEALKNIDGIYLPLVDDQNEFVSEKFRADYQVNLQHHKEASLLDVADIVAPNNLEENLRKEYLQAQEVNQVNEYNQNAEALRKSNTVDNDEQIAQNGPSY